MSSMADAFDLVAADRHLRNVGELLCREAWFSRDWLFDTHPFPAEPALPECVTLHIFRPGWFNEDHQGVHFESFLSPKEWKKKQLSVAMHIFHCRYVPGTSVKRREIAKPFIDACVDLVSSWPGYVFRAGRYGTHPFTYHLTFESETLVPLLAAEFTKLCLQLGPLMDRTLGDVVGELRH